MNKEYTDSGMEYESELAGPEGMSFVLKPIKGIHSFGDVNTARKELRRDRDVVGHIKVEWQKNEETPRLYRDSDGTIKEMPDDWIPDSKTMIFPSTEDERDRMNHELWYGSKVPDQPGVGGESFKLRFNKDWLPNEEDIKQAIAEFFKERPPIPDLEERVLAGYHYSINVGGSGPVLSTGRGGVLMYIKACRERGIPSWDIANSIMVHTDEGSAPLHKIKVVDLPKKDG